MKNHIKTIEVVGSYVTPRSTGGNQIGLIGFRRVAIDGKEHDAIVLAPPFNKAYPQEPDGKVLPFRRAKSELAAEASEDVLSTDPFFHVIKDKVSGIDTISVIPLGRGAHAHYMVIGDVALSSGLVLGLLEDPFARTIADEIYNAARGAHELSRYPTPIRVNPAPQCSQVLVNAAG